MSRFILNDYSYSVPKVWGLFNIIVGMIGIWLHYGNESGQFSLFLGTIGITCGVIQIVASNDIFRTRKAVDIPNS